MRRTLTAIACIAAVAAVAGCGESDQEQAREVAQEYVDASNDGDFEKICDLYSEEFIEQLGAADCPAFVQEQSSGVAQTLELVEVRATEDRATAEIDAIREEEGGPARIVAQLEPVDGEWRITAFH
jgi:hypothetical protein